MNRRAALLLFPVFAGCPAPPTDVQLDPPAQGFQLTTTSFSVAAGAETQRCFFFTVPGS